MESQLKRRNCPACLAASEAGGCYSRQSDSGPGQALRHSEHAAHLLSNIEKPALPILGSMFPFWIPTGDWVCQLEATSTQDSLSGVCCFPSIDVLRHQPGPRRVRGPRAPLARCTWVVPAQLQGHHHGGHTYVAAFRYVPLKSLVSVAVTLCISLSVMVCTMGGGAGALG